jgi:hypothetical protein
LAPILINFSRSVVNDQCFASFGNAGVRMKPEPDIGVAEFPAWQAHPLCRIFAHL